MSRALFENPIYIYATLGLATIVLAAIWHERRDKRLAWAMLVPVALAMTVAVVARLVVTDRERITAAAESIADAIQARRFELIAPYIDKDFSADVPLISLRATRSDVVAACKSQVVRHNVVKVAVGSVEVDISGRQARMRFRTMVHWGPDGRRRTPLIWRVKWIKRPDGWKVLELIDLKQGI